MLPVICPCFGTLLWLRLRGAKGQGVGGLRPTFMDRGLLKRTSCVQRGVTPRGSRYLIMKGTTRGRGSGAQEPSCERHRERRVGVLPPWLGAQFSQFVSLPHPAHTGFILFSRPGTGGSTPGVQSEACGA